MLTGKPLDRRKSPRIATNGELPGRMIDVNSGHKIACRSLDVSRMGLAIESEVELLIETRLILEGEGLNVTFQIVSRTQTRQFTPTFRYGLIVEHGDVDLEDLFRKKNLLLMPAKAAGSAKIRVVDRSPRYLPDHPLKLEASTFGTKNPYIVTIENLSRSGLLVGLVISEHLPFQATTLLDLVIDPKTETLAKPVRAVGKVVRRVDELLPPEAGKKQLAAVRLGIVIIEIDPRDEDVWHTTINALEGR